MILLRKYEKSVFSIFLQYFLKGPLTVFLDVFPNAPPWQKHQREDDSAYSLLQITTIFTLLPFGFIPDSMPNIFM